jgi:hypothetical protein
MLGRGRSLQAQRRWGASGVVGTGAAVVGEPLPRGSNGRETREPADVNTPAVTLSGTVSEKGGSRVERLVHLAEEPLSGRTGIAPRSPR